MFRGAPLSAMVRGRSPAPCQASDFDWRRDASASRPAGRPAIANFVFVSRFAALDSLSPCRRNERDIESGFFSFSLGEASSHRTTLSEFVPTFNVPLFFMQHLEFVALWPFPREIQAQLALQEELWFRFEVLGR